MACIDMNKINICLISAAKLIEFGHISYFSAMYFLSFNHHFNAIYFILKLIWNETES